MEEIFSNKVSGIGSSVVVEVGDDAGKSLDGVLVGIWLKTIESTISPASSLWSWQSASSSIVDVSTCGINEVRDRGNRRVLSRCDKIGRRYLRRRLCPGSRVLSTYVMTGDVGSYTTGRVGICAWSSTLESWLLSLTSSKIYTLWSGQLSSQSSTVSSGGRTRYSDTEFLKIVASWTSDTRVFSSNVEIKEEVEGIYKTLTRSWAAVMTSA